MRIRIYQLDSDKDTRRVKSKITSRPNGTAVFTLPNTSAFSTAM